VRDVRVERRPQPSQEHDKQLRPPAHAGLEPTNEEIQFIADDARDKSGLGPDAADYYTQTHICVVVPLSRAEIEKKTGK
jgi:hypothetical protein